MEEPLIPQKRSVETDTIPEVKEESEKIHHYSTRSSTKVHNTNGNGNLNIIIQPRLRPVPFKLIDCEQELKIPTKIKHIVDFSSKKDQGKTEVYYSTDEHPFNRRGFKYKPCRPNPDLQSNLYSTTDIPPYTVRLSYFDRSSDSLLSEDLMSLTSLQGWRSARSNIGIREGRFFMEFNILNSNEDGHVRIGIARREASIEAPVGFDGYGYGLRDKTGQKVHLSRPSEFMKGGFKTGDVIGILLELPSLEEQREISEKQLRSGSKQTTAKHEGKQKKIKSEIDEDDISKTIAIQKNNAIRDQIHMKYRSSLYFEQFEYTPTKEMDHLLHPVTVFGEKAVPDQNRFKPTTLPGSKIIVYKNGIEMGIAFENLYAFLPPNSIQSGNAHKSQDDGSLGYYPMISAFKKGCAELNPGPNFKFIPDGLKEDISDGKVRSLIERYNEKVCDDILWDIIDEVEAEYLDSF